MKGKTLLILVVAALVLGGLAVLTSRREAAATSSAMGKPVLPGLPVNDVRNIVVTDGAETATVTRVNDTWVSADKHNYPADFEKVRDALIKLSELKVGQVMKVDSDQRERLKMIAPSSAVEADTTGTLVELRDESNLLVGSLLLGDTRMRKSTGEPMSYGGGADGQYVSPDQGRTVYLVAEALDNLSASPKQWLNTELTSVTASDVTTVTIQHPGEEPIRLVRPDSGGDLEVQGLSKKEESDASKMYGVSSALSYLRLDDVADPALTDEALGLDKPIVYTAVTQKGEIYTVALGASTEGDSGRYARLSVALSPEEPEADAGETAPDAEADSEAEAMKKAAEERRLLEEQTADLNARLAPWTYVIASYKADAMTHTRDALVKEKEKEKKKDD